DEIDCTQIPDPVSEVTDLETTPQMNLQQGQLDQTAVIEQTQQFQTPQQKLDSAKVGRTYFSSKPMMKFGGGIKKQVALIVDGKTAAAGAVLARAEALGIGKLHEIDYGVKQDFDELKYRRKRLQKLQGKKDANIYTDNEQITGQKKSQYDNGLIDDDEEDDEDSDEYILKKSTGKQLKRNGYNYTAQQQQDQDDFKFNFAEGHSEGEFSDVDGLIPVTTAAGGESKPVWKKRQFKKPYILLDEEIDNQKERGQSPKKYIVKDDKIDPNQKKKDKNKGNYAGKITIGAGKLEGHVVLHGILHRKQSIPIDLKQVPTSIKDMLPFFDSQYALLGAFQHATQKLFSQQNIVILAPSSTNTQNNTQTQNQNLNSALPSVTTNQTQNQGLAQATITTSSTDTQADPTQTQTQTNLQTQTNVPSTTKTIPLHIENPKMGLQVYCEWTGGVAGELDIENFGPMHIPVVGSASALMLKRAAVEKLNQDMNKESEQERNERLKKENEEKLQKKRQKKKKLTKEEEINEERKRVKESFLEVSRQNSLSYKKLNDIQKEQRDKLLLYMFDLKIQSRQSKIKGTQNVAILGRRFAFDSIVGLPWGPGNMLPVPGSNSNFQFNFTNKQIVQLNKRVVGLIVRKIIKERRGALIDELQQEIEIEQDDKRMRGEQLDEDDFDDLFSDLVSKYPPNADTVAVMHNNRENKSATPSIRSHNSLRSTFSQIHSQQNQRSLQAFRLASIIISGGNAVRMMNMSKIIFPNRETLEYEAYQFFRYKTQVRPSQQLLESRGGGFFYHEPGKQENQLLKGRFDFQGRNILLIKASDNEIISAFNAVPHKIPHFLETEILTQYPRIQNKRTGNSKIIRFGYVPELGQMQYQQQQNALAQRHLLGGQMYQLQQQSAVGEVRQFYELPSNLTNEQAAVMERWKHIHIWREQQINLAQKNNVIVARLTTYVPPPSEASKLRDLISLSPMLHLEKIADYAEWENMKLRELVLVKGNEYQLMTQSINEQQFQREKERMNIRNREKDQQGNWIDPRLQQSNPQGITSMMQQSIANLKLMQFGDRRFFTTNPLTVSAQNANIVLSNQPLSLSLLLLNHRIAPIALGRNITTAAHTLDQYQRLYQMQIPSGSLSQSIAASITGIPQIYPLQPMNDNFSISQSQTQNAFALATSSFSATNSIKPFSTAPNTLSIQQSGFVGAINQGQGLYDWYRTRASHTLQIIPPEGFDANLIRIWAPYELLHYELAFRGDIIPPRLSRYGRHIINKQSDMDQFGNYNEYGNTRANILFQQWAGVQPVNPAFAKHKNYILRNKCENQDIAVTVVFIAKNRWEQSFSPKFTIRRHKKQDIIANKEIDKLVNQLEEDQQNNGQLRKKRDDEYYETDAEYYDGLIIGGGSTDKEDLRHKRMVKRKGSKYDEQFNRIYGNESKIASDLFRLDFGLGLKDQQIDENGNEIDSNKSNKKEMDLKSVEGEYDIRDVIFDENVVESDKFCSGTFRGWPFAKDPLQQQDQQDQYIDEGSSKTTRRAPLIYGVSTGAGTLFTEGDYVMDITVMGVDHVRFWAFVWSDKQPLELFALDY
ncbi:MAG: hypothetical protein EZS28_014434, partial [Streblomastix strix]